MREKERDRHTDRQTETERYTWGGERVNYVEETCRFYETFKVQYL